MGTARAIKNAQELFDDTFLVFNADILSDIDISEMIRFHEEKGGIATIAATRVDNPSAYGVIEHDENDRITAFKEKPLPHESSSNLINAGIYIFEPEILNEIPSGRPVSIEREIYPLLLKKALRLWSTIGVPTGLIWVRPKSISGCIRIYLSVLFSLTGTVLMKKDNISEKLQKLIKLQK